MHYNGIWRQEQPVGGLKHADYLNGSIIEIKDQDGEQLNMLCLIKDVEAREVGLKGRSLGFQYLMNGFLFSADNDSDLLSFWNESDLDQNGSAHIFMEYNGPMLVLQEGEELPIEAEMGSEPQPILTPSLSEYEPTIDLQPTLQQTQSQVDTDWGSWTEWIGCDEDFWTDYFGKGDCSEKPPAKKKTKKGKTTTIVLDEEHEDVADVTLLLEEELDELPNTAFTQPNIDELPIVDGYQSGESSESDDPDFDASLETDMDNEDDGVFSDFEDDASINANEELLDNAFSEEPPNYNDFKGCGKETDDLYTDKECGLQEDQLLEIDKLEKGMEWPTMLDFKRFFANYCIIKSFEVRGEKNESYRYRGKCVEEGCPWTIYVKKNKNDLMCTLKTLNDVHTCLNKVVGRNKMADSKWVSYMIERDIRENEMTFTPKNIIAKIWNAHGVPITYWIAWQARGKTLTRIYGSYEDGYKKAPEVCRQVLLANPGSVATCSRDNREGNFTSMCIAFKSFLQGFIDGCRPLIGLDGCHLKGKYGGVCLSAVALDGNNGLYPLAIFICSVENTMNWSKFLEIIFPHVSRHKDPLTIISDRQKGLIQAVKNVFNCKHRFCFRHLYKNFKNKHKGEQLETLAWGAAKAFRAADHAKWMDMIKDASPLAYTWFMKNEPDSWARSKFDTTSKCEHITNNFSESFNNWILELRDKPLQRFVDRYHIKLMTLMYERKMTAMTWDINGLVPRAVRIIENLILKTRRYRVMGAAEYLWCALNTETSERWIVDLENKKCSCYVWDLTGIPCVHAIAVLNRLRMPLHEYCHDYHKVRTYLRAYTGHVTPMANFSEWCEPEYTVEPPLAPTQVGRPRTVRRRDEDEGPRPPKQTRKCKNCRGLGHNARTCRGPGSTRQKGTRARARGKGLAAAAFRVLRSSTPTTQSTHAATSVATTSVATTSVAATTRPTHQSTQPAQPYPQSTQEASSIAATYQQYTQEQTAASAAATITNFYNLYGYKPSHMRPGSRPPHHVFRPPTRVIGTKYQPYRPLGPRGG